MTPNLTIAAWFVLVLVLVLVIVIETTPSLSLLADRRLFPTVAGRAGS
jgi:hypothetical protein